MMYVHIDPEVLNRHPWVGVAIGGAGVLLMGFVVRGFWGEYEKFRGAGQPREVTIESVAVADGETQWVTLREGIWRCELGVETRRGLVEGWLFGPVENTQMPVIDVSGSKLVVVKYDGQVPCGQVADRPVTGVVAREGERVWGSGVSARLKKLPHRPPLLVLHANAGPEEAKRSLLLASAFFALFSAFAAYYLKKWRVRRAARPGGARA